MLKSLLTLMRGTANDAVEATIDHKALVILDQQIRDCGAAVNMARKALAIAIAQDRQEQGRLEKLGDRIGDLEARATRALNGDREDLANQAAEAIAALEDERDAGAEAQASFAKECQRLRAVVRSSEQRLRDLERGRRTAKTYDAVIKLRDKGLGAGQGHLNTLSEAEATLERLRSRQRALDHATEALDQLEADTSSKTITDRMADAGFGAPTQNRAADVLERLKANSMATSAQEGARQ